jgi:hypothetical protein
MLGVPASVTTGALTLLQAQATPLFGRTSELDVIEKKLIHERIRLLTLTGPAGVGKTRLAVEVGCRLGAAFQDGAFVSDLSPLRDARLVLPTIAQSLGMVDSREDVLLDRLIELLDDRQILLALFIHRGEKGSEAPSDTG